MGPNSIYIWFKGRDGNAVDICGMVNGNMVDLCRNYFKIVTKGPSDELYNILDVSEVVLISGVKVEVTSKKKEKKA